MAFFYQKEEIFLFDKNTAANAVFTRHQPGFLSCGKAGVRAGMQRYKFNRQNKLKKNKQFQAVYKTGKSFANKYLVIYVLPNKSSKCRVGFAAGKRLGSAPKRNRAKRLLREAFRLNQHRLKSGFDLIFIARAPLIGLDYDSVSRIFNDIIIRARMITEQQEK